MIKFPIITFSALLVSGWYLFHWDLFFNSDFAMIGLLAKRTMEQGQQFVFVPKVGYQGLLIECNLAAFLFKMFGVSPTSLHLTAIIAFFVFLFVYYFSVRAWFSKTEATLAGILICFSSPLFSGNVLRTQPNYPETFALGCCLFWVYKQLLRESRPSYFCLLGLISGFGFYLYGQIIYFVASVILSYFLGPLLLWFSSHPAEKRKIKILFILCGFCALAPSIRFNDFRLAGVSLAIVLLLVYGIRMIFRFRKGIKEFFSQNLRPIFLTGSFFILGYSPSLYYRWIKGLPTKSGFALNKFSEEIFRNVGLIKEAFHVFAVGFSPFPIPQILTIGLIGLCLWFFFQDCKRHDKEARNPFWLLGLLILVAALVSRSVDSVFALRYTLCWQLVLSVAVAKCLSQIKQRHVWLATILFTVFVGYRTYHHLRAREQYPYYTEQLAEWKDIEPIIPFLKSKGIRKGYGDYWVSYITNFMTQEELILEPLFSNYLPFYEEELKKENQIALIKKGSLTWYEPKEVIKKQAHIILCPNFK